MSVELVVVTGEIVVVEREVDVVDADVAGAALPAAVAPQFFWSIAESAELMVVS